MSMSAHDTALRARWPGLRAAWRKLAGLDGKEAELSKAELASLASGIARLSQRLTRERDQISERYLDEPDLLGAYLLFYWPVSYVQARSVLGELGARPLGRVLDLGAGPLPLSWAALDAGASSVLALERVPRALSVGRTLGDSAALETHAWDATRDPIPAGPYDTIVSGHLWNELFLTDRSPLDRRAALLGRVLAALAPGGRVVIIEPALRETSRSLHALRDRAIVDGAVVLAPCLMQAPCPALVKPTDWCHAERSWSPPDELDALAEAARIHKDRLKLSYLVLAREAAPVFDASLFRIVSEPLDEKGKLVRVGCGPRGRHRLVLRERDVNDTNRCFASLSRGDVLRADALVEKGDGLRLVADGDIARAAAVGEPPPGSVG